jgi:hypothetical protein
MEYQPDKGAACQSEALLTDYRDFLGVRGLAEWPKDHPYAERAARTQ